MIALFAAAAIVTGVGGWQIDESASKLDGDVTYFA